MGLLFGDTYRRTNNTTNVIHKYPSTIKVHEHKAPTDESIKLWDEFMDKTKDKVLSAFKIDTGIVQLLSVGFIDESSISMTDYPSIIYHCKFNLNGNEEMFKIKLDSFEVQKYHKMHEHEADALLLKLFFKEVSEIIALRLIQNVKTTEIGLSKDYVLR